MASAAAGGIATVAAIAEISGRSYVLKPVVTASVILGNFAVHK